VCACVCAVCVCVCVRVCVCCVWVGACVCMLCVYVYAVCVCVSMESALKDSSRSTIDDDFLFCRWRWLVDKAKVGKASEQNILMMYYSRAPSGKQHS